MAPTIIIINSSEILGSGHANYLNIWKESSKNSCFLVLNLEGNYVF